MCNAHNHPPGCTCGWGGDGHAGISYGWQGYTPTVANGGVRLWPETNFTRPTHCPECGEEVYFIRHNGGSVWVDELGWPWPKHPCFDKPAQPTHAFGAWTAKSSGLTNPKLGLITRIINDSGTREPRLDIRLPDSSRVSLVLRWTPPDSDLLGALVVISEEDSLLLHPIHAEIAFHSLSQPVSTAPGWYQCTRCKATVKNDTGHEEHCRKHFSNAPVKSATRHVSQQPTKTKKKKSKGNSPLSRQPKPFLNYSPKPKHQVPSLSSRIPSPPLPARLFTLDARIQEGIESVARQAWLSVLDIESPEEQVQLAKRNALELIGMLSPAIKRQVGNHFTSLKWDPLLRRKPK